MKCDIQIGCPKNSSLPSKISLQKTLAFLSQEFELEDKTLSLRIVTRTEAQALNQMYCGKDYPTNVLSFPNHVPFVMPPKFQQQHLGDLVLCHAVIAKEALEQHKPLAHHYTHLLTHGLLHLLGHNHETEKEAAAMEQLEIDLLKVLDIPNPYENDSDGT